MLLWLLPVFSLPTASAAEEMSAGRLRELAARSPSVFDVFFAREATDTLRQPRFYATIEAVGSWAPMESRFLLPSPTMVATESEQVTTVLPTQVVRSVTSLVGVGTLQSGWGWRAGMDLTQVGLTAEEEAVEQRALAVPDGGWYYANALAWGGVFHRERGLSFTAGGLYRMVPLVEEVGGTPHFTTQPDDTGSLDGTDIAGQAFVHAGWTPLGQLALTVGSAGVAQAVYRRPVVLSEETQVGPLVGWLPALQQVRVGGFVEDLAIHPRWCRLDAELQGRHEGDAGAGLDHASVQWEARLRHDPDPPSAHYPTRNPAHIDRELWVRGRVSTWTLAEDTVTGGALELALAGVRLRRQADMGFGLGVAWNDYRALTLLPLADQPLMTFTIDGGL